MVDVFSVDSLGQPTARKRVPATHLRAAREARKMSQEDLAKILDVRVPTISERENSEKGVAWEIWVAWSCALQLGVEWKPGDPISPWRG